MYTLCHTYYFWRPLILVTPVTIQYIWMCDHLKRVLIRTQCVEVRKEGLDLMWPHQVGQSWGWVSSDLPPAQSDRDGQAWWSADRRDTTNGMTLLSLHLIRLISRSVTYFIFNWIKIKLLTKFLNSSSSNYIWYVFWRV